MSKSLETVSVSVSPTLNYWIGNNLAYGIYNHRNDMSGEVLINKTLYLPNIVVSPLHTKFYVLNSLMDGLALCSKKFLVVGKVVDDIITRFVGEALCHSLK